MKIEDQLREAAESGEMQLITISANGVPVTIKGMVSCGKGFKPMTFKPKETLPQIVAVEAFDSDVSVYDSRNSAKIPQNHA